MTDPQNTANARALLRSLRAHKIAFDVGPFAGNSLQIALRQLADALHPHDPAQDFLRQPGVIAALVDIAEGKA